MAATQSVRCSSFPGLGVHVSISPFAVYPFTTNGNRLASFAAAADAATLDAYQKILTATLTTNGLVWGTTDGRYPRLGDATSDSRT